MTIRIFDVYHNYVFGAQDTVAGTLVSQDCGSASRVSQSEWLIGLAWGRQVGLSDSALYTRLLEITIAIYFLESVNINSTE